MLKNIYKTFPGGKHKVLTMSYDDGKKADIPLVEIFNRYGIKGTFHLNSGLFDRDPERIATGQIRSLYQGHEISAHTSTHPTIERCPLDQVFLQVHQDRAALEELAGYTVRGISYPNGSYSEEIKKLLPMAGIEYARIVGNSENFAMPVDFMEWKSTCHHNHRLLELGEEFAALDKSQYLYMMYVWGHSYEFDRDDNWDVIETFCKNLGGRDDIWYATNIEIVDYLKAWDMLKFSAKGDFVWNPTAMTLWVEVDKKAVELPPSQQTYL